MENASWIWCHSSPQSPSCNVLSLERSIKILPNPPLLESRHVMLLLATRETKAIWMTKEKKTGEFNGFGKGGTEG